MCTLTVLLVLGLAVGFIGGYAGIGGAPFMIAFLVLVCGIPQLEAQGSVLTMMLGPMSLLGVLTLKKEVKAQWKNISIGVVAYALFSYFGAELAFYLGEVDVRHYFAFLLILVAILQLFSKYLAGTGNQTTHIPYTWMLLIGMLTGIIGGLFGIGAGVLMVPVFLGFFKLNKNYARALSLAILLPPVSIGAFVKYNVEGAIDWKLVGLLFVSYFIANYFGTKLGSRSSILYFKIMYTIILLSLACIYLFM